MSNVKPFNYDLDKITEREVVYDFLSRLSLGIDFINKDCNTSENPNDKRVIMPAGAMFKDEVLLNMIRTMDTSDIMHLDSIRTAYKTIDIGENSVSIIIPDGCSLYKIVQEKTGHDVTDCFIENGNYYVSNFDVPATHKDTYKAYYHTV